MHCSIEKKALWIIDIYNKRHAYENNLYYSPYLQVFTLSVG